MKIHKHIDIDELLAPHARKLSDSVKLLLFDQRVLDLVRAYRDRYGVIYINTDLYGGKLIWRGFRDCSCEDGNALSQHRFGRAVDCTFKNVTTEEVREDIRKNQVHWNSKLGLTRVEEGTPHLHSDFGYTGLISEIKFFKG